MNLTAATMYKKNSYFQQRRESRAEELSRKNTGGVDESAFQKDADDIKRREITARKREIELRLSKLSAYIYEADLRRKGYRGPEQHGWEQARKWRDERQLLVTEIGRIEKLLSSMRLNKAHSAQIDTTTFERAFVKSAKALLAKPIFDRIVIAALHGVEPHDGQT